MLSFGRGSFGSGRPTKLNSSFRKSFNPATADWNPALWFVATPVNCKKEYSVNKIYFVFVRVLY